MEIYGDESGHLRNLLNGECDIFVLAAVGGDPHDCGGCPKRAVRNVSRLDETRWTDLTPTQKRRVMECFAEPKRQLSTAYIALRRSDLDALKNAYLLYQDRAFEIDWDLALIGHGYAQLLNRIEPAADTNSTFTFDRLFGKAQSDLIGETIRSRTVPCSVAHGSSHQTRGIQAADCLAGAAADHYRGVSKWIEILDSEPDRVTDEFLTEIKQLLEH